ESVRRVVTDRGAIDVEQVVVAVGPWVKHLWRLLDLPERIVQTADGVKKGLGMWTYWQLQEGEIEVDPERYTTADGKVPPVLHVDSTEPLISDRTGELITRELWGIYFKRDRAGVQGGAVPILLGPDAQVDPYGPASPHYTARESFADYW